VKRTTVIELYKEDMKFSAGHFTIFSEERRERLHGHNFNISAAFTVRVSEAGGMGVDYGVYKKQLVALCKAWNEYFLLPGRSPFLEIVESENTVTARFGDEDIPFLKTDVLVLPIANVTLEELAGLLLEKVVKVRDSLGHTQIEGIIIKVFSGPGQNASAQWAVAP
jgi:6-pyruvoyltetrahydropterin/6-carboxytetrahydropterin synthase